MKIFVLGATGRTGTLILLEALKRGHTVTALVRNPSSLDTLISNLPPSQKANLHLVRGSPLNATDVTTAITTASSSSSSSSHTPHVDGPLVVISALNPRRTSENPWAAPHPTDSPPRMMADSIAHVLAALAQRGSAPTPKVIHVSAMGVGASAAQAPWFLRKFVAYSNIQLTYMDHEAVEAELVGAGGGFKWVLVRPARLTDEDGVKGEVWPVERGVVGMMAKTSRGAVATFCLDAAEGSEWDGKDPIILG